jgi:DNA primase
MNDLVAELKTRLRIEELVGASVKLVRSSRQFKGCCPFHNEKTPSFYVTPERGNFKCFGCGASGDVLTWLGFERFNKLRVDGEDFIEVLRMGCERAGIAFPETREANAKTVEKRRLEEILERYVSCCESLRDAEFYVQAKQRKGYLTAEVCERWRLGKSATVSEWRAFGISDDEMKSVNLYRHSADRAGEWYAFFRESIIIPTIFRGRVQYLSSRYLKDTLPSGALREKKTLHMPSLDLLPRPCGFNLDCLYDAETREKGVRLVEAPLDAIASCELGKPAVGMFGSTPSEELARVIAKVA